MASPVGEDKDHRGNICHTFAEKQVHWVYEPSNYDSLSYSTYNHITAGYLNANTKQGCYGIFNSAPVLHIPQIYTVQRLPTKQQPHFLMLQSNSAQNKADLSGRA